MKYIKELLKIAVLFVILIGVLYSQNNFTQFQVKQPTLLKQLTITLQYVDESVLDTLGYEIDREIVYNSSYSIILHDVDGNVVRAGIMSGDLKPYLNAGQMQSMKALLDVIALKAKKLID